MDLKWFGQREGSAEWFPATVPGNIQRDYALFQGWGDLNYGDNCKQYLEIEDSAWFYHTSFDVSVQAGQRVVFVTKGIDYEYEIFLNGESLYRHEGLYSPLEIDLTDRVKPTENALTVKIFPHPKREGAPVSRTQADNCVKPPVGYGWDWHPRIIPSGIWNETGIELRDADSIEHLNVTYTLSEDFSKGELFFDFACKGAYTIEVFAPDGTLVYQGDQRRVAVDSPLLWWCNGQGDPNLYSWVVSTAGDRKIGKTGFRRVELVMEDVHWAEPHGFPKSRSNPPVKICLNGRPVFAKGSNFVSPEIFPGTSDVNTYLPLVRLAKDAHMNIFRMWGGSGVQKDCFFDLCDANGIMVWQEFPLACNNYLNDPHYLEILEQEAVAIVCNLRQHCSVVLWCGGNELFNGWSKMTDQSHALRLLNKICYEYDRSTPFFATSPLAGMAHGCYLFSYRGQEVYSMFNNAHYTAYTEFGVPSVPSEEYLKTFIPEDQLFPPERGSTWSTHHAFDAWGADTWLCMNTLEGYFGKLSSVAEISKYSSWLQCEGYKAIFEEARRQKPYCSMAINWCYNEPWKTAGNNSLLSYPAIPKPAYYAVGNSLKNTVPSARLNKFSYESGETFSAELWLLNDGDVCVENDVVEAFVEIGGRKVPLLTWNVDFCDKNTNKQGYTVRYVLPKVKGIESFRLVLRSEQCGEQSYELHYRYKEKAKVPEIPVLNM